METLFHKIAATLEREPRRWVVTGCAGFIGSHLVERLLTLGQEVIGVDNFATGYRANLDDVAATVGEGVWRSFRFYEGSVTDPELCRGACEGADFVLHQAALGSVPRSIAEPQASHHANVDGFLTMLLSARGVRGFVYASSSSVYGDDPTLPKREQVVGEVLSPYAATKKINEIYAANIQRVYGVPCVGLRYFNVFGPRQDPNGAYAAVIPRWIAALVKGEPCTIYGDGETSRDFCFIENVVQANILAALRAEQPAPPPIVNVAAGGTTSLKQLYSLIAAELGTQIPPRYEAERQGDIRHSQADLTVARTALGYEPVVEVADGIQRTVQWFSTKLSSEV